MTIKAKKSKINLREKLAELLNFRQIRDRLDGLGLYLGKDRTGTAENLAVRGGASIDDLQLAEISAALGGTAVDVFVYDTRNDSDGGKWRERTSHTSWYNEELNTATRGGRREFPAVAVIVAESNKVTIYDGDDPDLSMWMVFNASGENFAYGNLSSLSMVNSRLAITTKDSASGNWMRGLKTLDFISEIGFSYDSPTNTSTDPNQVHKKGYYRGLVIDRNSGNGFDATIIDIVNHRVSNVAMTVLPDAPIDEDTGLPVPTIAVATDGGVSVIKDDGTVVDITSGGYSYIDITNNRIWVSRSDTDIIETGPLPSLDTNNASWRETSYNDSSTIPSLVGVSQAGMPVIQNYVGNNGGLTYMSEEINNLSNSMAAYTTSKYNTGWMPGDIKLATLSDTTVENIGVNSDELVTNGGFDGDTYSGWTESGSPNIVFSSPGVVDISGDGEGLYQDIAPGTYLVSVGNLGGAGGEVRFTDMNSNQRLFTALQSGDSSVVTSVGDLRVYLRASGGNTASFDNISVRATTELITNGDFSSGTTGWTLGASWTISSGVADPGVGASYLDQTISTVSGKRYVAAIEVAGYSAGGFNILFDAVASPLYNSNGVHFHTFTATSSSHLLRIWANDGTVGTVDNISVRLAEPDRSVNDNGLQVFGEIDKTPVAPGADLVAYSGFSADDYLMQPYNSDLDFGTGDFSIIGWVNKNSTNTQVVLNSGDGSSSRLYIYISSANELRFAAGGTGTNIYGSIGSDSIWNQITIVRKDGVVYGYINGVLQASYSNPDAVTHSSNDTLKIGLGTTGLYPFGGSLSLIRFTATSITPDQIAKIYRDEKALFTDGAQATLYGTSDSVTALSYDEKTELLHVGTSSGRSDFSGLRRINNTTTAITTSISAHNNLIAEQ